MSVLILNLNFDRPWCSWLYLMDVLERKKPSKSQVTFIWTPTCIRFSAASTNQMISSHIWFIRVKFMWLKSRRSVIEIQESTTLTHPKKKQHMQAYCYICVAFRKQAYVCPRDRKLFNNEGAYLLNTETLLNSITASELHIANTAVYHSHCTAVYWTYYYYSTECGNVLRFSEISQIWDLSDMLT